MRFSQPLFKFLKSEHADQLLLQGRVYLPTLYECRDATRYCGTTCDQTEGRVYVGGMSGMNSFEYENCYIYCASSHLFSRSLQWAMEEAKQTCVMIWDPERFFAAFSEGFPDLEWVGVRPCLYVKSKKGKLFRGALNFQPITSDSVVLPFLKPTQHEPQTEVRAVLKPRHGATIVGPRWADIPSIRECLLPINFHDVRLPTLLDPSRVIGARLTLKVSKGSPSFIVAEPRESFSPIVHYFRHQHPYIGFANPRARNVAGLDADGAGWAYIGMMTSPIGPVVLNGPLEDIAQINIVVASDEECDAERRARPLTGGEFGGATLGPIRQFKKP